MSYRLPVIIWDAFGFNSGHGGINSYAASMAAAMGQQKIWPHAICTQDAPVDFLPAKQCILLPSFPYRVLKRVKLLWPRFAFRHVRRFLGAQKAIYHGLSNVNLPVFDRSLKRSKQVQTVLTVHDLIPLLAGSSVSCSYREQFRVMLRSALDAADAIVCVSDWTKDTLLDRASYLDSRVIVIPNARPSNHEMMVEGKVLPKQESEVLKLCYVARFDVYKQIHLFGDIIECLAKRCKVAAVLVTDRRGMMFAQHAFNHLIQKGILSVQVSLTEAQLRQVYRDSSVYIHPSLFEGFGLPALEALCAGTPVVFQGGSALSQILPKSTCVEMRDASPVESWADAVLQARLNSYSELFRSQVASFVCAQPTWDENAAKLLDIYAQLA
ncbi:MAG: glycosyltransferase [Zetaproteobacteria bacterium]|nr:glycosyltransferase [Zetaproteobacteria bacterium]